MIVTPFNKKKVMISIMVMDGSSMRRILEAVFKI